MHIETPQALVALAQDARDLLALWPILAALVAIRVALPVAFNLAAKHDRGTRK
jgi:hypothetical protein